MYTFIKYGFAIKNLKDVICPSQKVFLEELKINSSFQQYLPLESDFKICTEIICSAKLEYSNKLVNCNKIVGFLS